MSNVINEFTCVVCPWGCSLKTHGENISGYSCTRGLRYAQKEQTDPRRAISGSVRIVGAVQNALTVKTSAPVPKHLLLDAAKLLCTVTVSPPIRTGDVIIPNILGTGINFIAARSLDAIRLPKAVLETASIKENEQVRILAERNQIIIKKSRKHREHITLAERLKDWNGQLYDLNDEDESWLELEPAGNETW